MALNPLNSTNLEHLAFKGLMHARYLLIYRTPPPLSEYRGETKRSDVSEWIGLGRTGERRCSLAQNWVRNISLKKFVNSTLKSVNFSTCSSPMAERPHDACSAILRGWVNLRPNFRLKSYVSCRYL